MNHTNDLFWNQNGEFRRKVTSLHPCTLQMWMNDVKYNQVLNQTLVPPGVNSQATL